MLLTDYEKASDEVICSKLHKILKNNRFPSQSVNATQSLYQNTRITIDKGWKEGKLTAQTGRCPTRVFIFTHTFLIFIWIGSSKTCKVF
jgi:hypothetical protein